MFDHGAMGPSSSASSHPERDSDQAGAPLDRRSTPGPFLRATLARGLRRGADLLQPQTVGELAK